MSLNAEPLVLGDAEIDAVANPPIGHEHVVAKSAFFGGANTRQRLPGCGVERVGFELHPDAAQGLEGMTQLQVFCLRVDSGPLPGWGDLGAADLHAPVVAIDIEVAGGPDELCDGLGYRGEADHQTRLLFGQFRSDIGPHLLLGAHGVGQILLDRFMRAGIPQRRDVGHFYLAAAERVRHLKP
jgi:hypothetical protein